MQLRPYQFEFVDEAFKHLIEYDRVLGVAATGAGKTVMAAEIIKNTLPEKCLFLADAQELVKQTAQKVWKWTRELPAIEMAHEKAKVGDSVVIATTQSIAQRLDKWPRDYFSLIIVDEAHRNTLGTLAMRVLGHFNEAQVIGITATPFRSDKKQLSTFYEAVCCEIGLMRLIQEGFLSKILVKSVPVGVDLSDVRTTAGDYNDADLGDAIEPHLSKLAQLLKEHASERKTVVFLPLIETSKRFTQACNDLGLKAVHVDGKDKDALRGDWQVICNAQLLTTGWDEPSVDCVYILRPTKSLVMYSQMVGRGTRIHPGKENLLLLDPLYLSDRHDLIRPARLVARTEEEATSIQDKLDVGESSDLLDTRKEAEADRLKAMADQLAKNALRAARTVDAIELALNLNASDLAEYEPEFMWESMPMTDKQREVLENNGIDVTTIKSKGHASKVLDLIFKRRDLKLATPKQVRWLAHFNHPDPHLATFQEANEFLERKFGRRKAS